MFLVFLGVGCGVGGVRCGVGRVVLGMQAVERLMLNGIWMKIVHGRCRRTVGTLR